jgi:hypothetical protein
MMVLLLVVESKTFTAVTAFDHTNKNVKTNPAAITPITPIVTVQAAILKPRVT